MVGVDGSEPAKRAVAWCARYAGALGAEVVVLHAIDMPFYVSPVPASVETQPLSPEDRAELGDQVTNEWCSPLAAANVPFRVVLIDHDPALAIMRVAREEQADFVVVGRRGLGGFAEMLLGSTSYALTHHLDRPLLIIP